MLKQLIAALLLLAFVVQTLKAPFLLMDYYANTAVYAKNCINKAKPALHCNGKCQMMKQLQEEEKKEQQDAANKLEIKLAILASKVFYCTAREALPLRTKLFLPEINIPLKKISLDIFHPPQV